MGAGCGGNTALLAGRRLSPGGSARDPMVCRWRDQISSDCRDLRYGASERRFCSNGSPGTAAHTAREFLRSRVRLATTPAAVSGLGGRPPKLTAGQCKSQVFCAAGRPISTLSGHSPGCSATAAHAPNGSLPGRNGNSSVGWKAEIRTRFPHEPNPSRGSVWHRPAAYQLAAKSIS